MKDIIKILKIVNDLWHGFTMQIKIFVPIQYVVKFKSFYAKRLVKHSNHRSCHKMAYNKYFTT